MIYMLLYDKTLWHIWSFHWNIRWYIAPILSEKCCINFMLVFPINIYLSYIYIYLYLHLKSPSKYFDSFNSHIMLQWKIIFIRKNTRKRIYTRIYARICGRIHIRKYIRIYGRIYSRIYTRLYAKEYTQDTKEYACLETIRKNTQSKCATCGIHTATFRGICCALFCC